MEVRITGDEEIAVLNLEGGAAGLKYVAGDLVQVKETGEEIVLIVCAEDARSIAGEAAGRSGAIMGQNRQEIARSLVAFDDIMLFSINATVDCVDEAVATAQFRMLEESGGENPLPFGCESDVHWIIHPTRHHRLHQGVAGTAPEDVGCARNPGRLAGTFISLFSKRAFAPVNPSVQAEIRTVQIVGASSEGFPLKPFLALVRDAVSIGISKFPDARRCGYIERSIEPHRAFGKHHFVGEHDTLVKPAVPVRVFQPHDSVRLLL